MLVRRRQQAKLELIEAADLIPDGRLAESETDLLEHDAIARGVAEIALAARAPVNIALFGAWGSGKSSVYAMITNHLNRIAPHEVRLARYDAWKYGGHDLKRNFVHSVADELGFGDDPEFTDGMTDEVSTARLNIPGWLKRNWGSLLVGLGIAVGIALIWSSLLLAATVWLGKSPFVDALKALTPPTAVVFGAALVAVIVGPQALQGAVIAKKRPPPSGADQFAHRFGVLVAKARTGRVKRLVVFIDELDRCSPEDVVATLIDLKTFLDHEHCVFIVAADREVIEQSLRKTPQAKPVREDEPYFATPGAFLDKIFQHQIALPPLRARALTRFAQDLVQDQDGLWKKLRDHGPDTFDRAVFALIPVHVRSPRRVKILLNNFATTCRIAQARGITWLDRAHELAVLTVLQTEFPSVAEELRRVPRLLVYLRGDEESKVPEIVELVVRFADRADVPATDTRLESATDSSETPAGELLSDDQADPKGRKRRYADLTLRRHLSMYLAKVRAAGIADPRPDLLYLQSAVNGLALNDPRLGDMIDFAADTAPDDVVRAFADQDSQTLAIGVALLVTEGDNSHGLGRGFAYESACRLIEKIDRVDDAARQVVIREAAPSLVAAASARALSHRSVPGALLAACWVGQDGHVVETLRQLMIEDASDDVRSGLVDLFPYLHGTAAELLVELLVQDFDHRPAPLTSALIELPAADAVTLWKMVAPFVYGIVRHRNLEAADAHSAATTTAGGVRPAPAETDLDGEHSIARLCELVAAVRGRQDHEEILSAIVSSAQADDTDAAIRQWAFDQADALIATMASPSRRTRHGLLGMLHYPVSSWDTWEAYLAEEDLGAEAVALSPLATEVLIERLFPAITTADETVCAKLPAVASRLIGLAEVDDHALSDAISSVTSPMRWVQPSATDPASTAIWARKNTVAEVALAVGAEEGGDVVETLALDLLDAVDDLVLDEEFVAHWLPMARRLPESAVRYLSGRLDEYEFKDDDPATIVRMKLGVRRCFGGAALPVAELTVLPEGVLDSTMTADWLALTPRPEDVRVLIGNAPFKPANLGAYSRALPLSERTDLWLAVWESNRPAELLDAMGRNGIGPRAVEVVRAAVVSITRGSDRIAAVERLLAAKCPDEDTANREVRRAVSDFALELLSRDTAVDLGTATRLVLWAGGAGDRSITKLRTAFTAAYAKGKRAPKEHTDQLTKLGLLDLPKKGIVGLIMGR